MFLLVLVLIVAFICFAFSWLNYPRYCKSKVCLIGKTAIVSGANRGIGYETALNLASRGCRVVLATRSNGDQAKNKIIKITHNTNIVAKKLDLNSFASIRKFADEIIKEEDHVNILINNAGIGLSKPELTEDGFHPVCQTNHFGPLLLTYLLLDKLKQSDSSRIIFVSSLFAFRHDLTLDNLNHEILPVSSTVGEQLKVYANTKLCNIITAKMLNKELEHLNVKCFSVQPGYSSTDVSGQIKDAGAGKLFEIFYMNVMLPLVTKDAEYGAQAVIKAAISSEVEDLGGALIWDKGWFPNPLKCRDLKFCRDVFEKSKELLKINDGL